MLALSPFAQTKTVAINVAVLGAKQQSVRYYHPINGTYKFTPKTITYKPSELKGLSQFALIQPGLNLHDSVNIIQANSLRHYVDPSELIYVDWKMGRDTSNYLRLDTFAVQSEIIRNEKYAALVKDYFDPFFISKYEVTNKEYREFTDWVRDSIFREAIYASDAITDEQAIQMLNVTDDQYYDEVTMKWETVESPARKINRELYALNYDFDYRKEFRDDVTIPILSQFYKRPNERFYKRLEVAQSYLNYRYYSIDREAAEEAKSRDTLKKKQNYGLRYHFSIGPYIINHTLNIYPDTAAWKTFYNAQFSSVMGNMYFWHPAFDNMPVVGVSHEQAKAYCDWKQKQIQKSNPKVAREFTVDLPKLIEYEWAITSGYSQNLGEHIEDNQIVSNLLLGDKKETRRPTSFNYKKSLLQKVFRPYDVQNKKAHRKFLKLIKKYDKDKYSGIIGTKHEVIMRAQGNYLASKVEFLSNNASEWMCEDYETNYKALLEAYINYNCFANPEYCENQRNIDQNLNRLNDVNGRLIIGANWYDERYGSYAGVNKAGLYPKAFKSKSNAYATVGFRLILRMNPPTSQN